MSIRSFISTEMDICQLQDKIGDIQKKFEDLSYTHVPVENEKVYLGCISENDIGSFEPEKTLADYQYALEGFFAREYDYWLDTLETFARHQTNILPVLDAENQYLGYLELYDILNLFNETPFLNEPGGIVVVEKGYREYSFSEVGQIIESHNSAILGMFVSSKTNDLTQITIKLSSTSMNEILQTFRRYGYSVVSEHPEDIFDKDLKDRSQYLGKYLNI